MNQVAKFLIDARYVAAAYSILWIALLAYLISVGVRIGTLQKELGLLAEIVERRLGKKDEG